MSDNLKKAMIGVVAAFVVLIIIVFIISSCQGSHQSYENYQKQMEKAAQSYFESNEEELPTNDKQTSEYTLKEMIEAGAVTDYIKAFNDESLKCDGGVTVTNNNGYYLYTSELDCGEAYTSQTLKDKIIEDNLVESGQGLYEVGDIYYFRGDTINNYLSFANQMWRIIGIEEDGNISLLQVKTDNYCTWDNHYNTELGDVGLNIYYRDGEKTSTMKECLAGIYKDKIDEKYKASMSTQTVCFGARSKDDITTDGSSECSEYISGEPLSLIAVYEYVRTSIDENCKTLSDLSCANYNWLSKSRSTFTITPSPTKSTKVYKLSRNINESNASGSNATLMKIQLDSKINYKSGNGTEEDPYLVGDPISKK